MTDKKLDLGLGNISRLEIIDENGRAYVRWGMKITQILSQDNNQTLKIFVEESSNDGEHA